jgi:hypothetical protein
MAEVKKLLKTLREYNELSHELWIGNIGSALFYWDENMKALKKQIEIWSLADKDFKINIDRIFAKMPFEAMKKGYEDKAIVHKSIDELIEANADYVGYLTTISNMIAKDRLKAMKTIPKMYIPYSVNI